MTPAEAKALIAQLAPACKEHGIRRVRVGEVEIEFGSGNVDPQALEKFSQAFEKGFPTDEEAMFWSAPGFVPKPPQEPPKPRTARERKAQE